MIDHKTGIEDLLFTLGFSHMASLSDQNSFGLVYGRVIKLKNSPPITMRVLTPIKKMGFDWTADSKPLVIRFVYKNKDGQVEKIGSERLINTNKISMDEWLKELETILISEWQVQLTEKDEHCEKCKNGIFEVRDESGKVIRRVKCSRCEGKGWKNYNDRRKNLSNQSIEDILDRMGEEVK